MAFIISKAQPSSFSSEAADQKMRLHSKDGEVLVPEASQSSNSNITSHLYLKSSSANSSAQAATLDRDVVLRRIRHHKSLMKIKNAFQALRGRGSSEQDHSANMASLHQTWLYQGDSFSSP